MDVLGAMLANYCLNGPRGLPDDARPVLLRLAVAIGLIALAALL